jgi:hypothetical protein
MNIKYGTRIKLVYFYSLHWNCPAEELHEAGPSSRTVWGTYCLRPLEHWDPGFESRSRHGCVSAFFCVVLSCVGRGLASGRSPVQGVLQIVQIDSWISEVKFWIGRGRDGLPWSWWWWWIAPRILNLGTRGKWVVSCKSRPLYPRRKSPRYPLYRRLDGPQLPRNI